MPSQLVDGFRTLLAARDAPVTVVERAVLLAILAAHDENGRDTVDELEAAIAQAREVLYPTGGLPPAQLATITRLLRAARAVIDYGALIVDPDDGPDLTPADPTPYRADVDR